jgi:hypothetical protein
MDYDGKIDTATSGISLLRYAMGFDDNSFVHIGANNILWGAV